MTASPCVDHPESSAATKRLIAVAVRDAERDRAVLDWVAFDAVVRTDSVHVVHAYVPFYHAISSWDPVWQASEQRNRVAGRIASQAAQRLRAARPDVNVDSSAIAGLPIDVLVELSHVVDLVVVGADTAGDALNTPHVAERVQEHTTCPVVCVPSDYQRPEEDLPVTVLLDEHASRGPALRFAAEYVRRHDVALNVTRADAVRPDVATHSGLLVVPASMVIPGENNADPSWLRCPTAVIPDRPARLNR